MVTGLCIEDGRKLSPMEGICPGQKQYSSNVLFSNHSKSVQTRMEEWLVTPARQQSEVAGDLKIVVR